MTGEPGPLGEVVREGGEVLLRFERSYQAPAAEIWAAATDPEQTSRWLGPWSGDPASGQVSLSMTDEADSPAGTVVIDRCDPPLRLDVTMSTGEGGWPLSLTLSEEAGSTRLVFVHRLAEPYDASSIGPGWQYYLDRLAAVLAGSPVPGTFEDYYPRLADRYAVPESPAG